MKFNLLFALFTCLFIFSCAAITNAQEAASKRPNVVVVGAKKTAAAAGKISYIIVKETAQIGWKTTKFTLKEIAAPTAKYIAIEAAPKASLFILKTSGKTIQKTTPIAVKAVITYLKL